MYLRQQPEPGTLNIYQLLVHSPFYVLHVVVPQRPKITDLKKQLLQITKRNLDYETCKLRMQGCVLNKLYKALPEIF